MGLYIQQKVFSWVDRFTIKDEYGTDRYFVQGELFSWGKQLHLSDAAGREVAFIRQKVFAFLPRFFVSVNGVDVAEIVKEFTFLRPRYRVDGLDWEIEGNFWAHDYDISRNGRIIVRIRKQWMTWGDCYELDIADSQDEVMAIAVALAIDCVMDQAQQGANN